MASLLWRDTKNPFGEQMVSLLAATTQVEQKCDVPGLLDKDLAHLQVF